MAEWLQMAASLVSVLMLCGVIFNFSVIKPLNQSVRSLQECIDHLRRQLAGNYPIRNPNDSRWQSGCPGWKKLRGTCSIAWM